MQTMKKTAIIYIITASFISLLHAAALKPGDTFPSFTARSLNDTMVTVPDSVTPTVTLISLSFSRHDIAPTEAWTDTFTARYKNNPDVKYIEAAVIPDMPFISGIIANALRGAVAKQRWGDFVIYSGDKDAMMKKLSVDDPDPFYIYLTGKDGKILKILKTSVLTKEYIDEISGIIDKTLKSKLFH
jgi:hypothetical protein